MTEQTKDTASKVSPSPQPIEITEAAVKKVMASMKNEGKTGWGLRISVKIGGCAGFSYNMSFEEKPAEADEVIEQKGLKIFIEARALKMIRGIEIDYVDTLNESGFKFHNPNANSTCGCGTSFS